MRKKNRIWNNLPLFWKTFALSTLLAASVALIGEGAEDLVKKITGQAGLPLVGRLGEPLLWLLAIILSSLLGSLFISRVITGTLTRIQPVVERLSRGALDSRINRADAGRGDEIGLLSRSFNQMADNISRLLESERTLIRDISHEMRSPLARMKVALALLRREAGPAEPTAVPLEQLERDIDRLELMVNRNLERARMETIEQSGLEKSEFDLAALVAAGIEEQASGAAGDHKSISFEGPDAAPYCGHAVLLDRALANMLKNALSHTARHGTVSVRLRAVAGAFIVEVVDQGPGVPEEHLEDIFRPFYRVAAAREDHGGGFGLGLAIARQAAQLHGGQVTAVNVAAGGPNRGLKVALTLPAAPPAPGLKI
jgi:two-component system sensor histidine kinase CpxA